jgi:UDP-N-acetylmuramyl pentapeptide phosphotransferase/UDP-N-acetylglucosamine-1-phosphate transferase
MSQIRLVNYWLILVITFVIVSCSNEPELIDGYSVYATGLHYKMCALGEGEKHPKNGFWII